MHAFRPESYVEPAFRYIDADKTSAHHFHLPAQRALLSCLLDDSPSLHHTDLQSGQPFGLVPQTSAATTLPSSLAASFGPVGTPACRLRISAKRRTQRY